MTRLVFATDIHLTDRMPVNRITPIFPTCLYKLDAILSYAKTNNAFVVLGGDLFDNPCPTYTLYSSLISILKRYNDLDIYTTYGNHDLLFGNVEGTALEALIKSGFIKHISDISTKDANVHICDYSKRFTESVEIAEELLGIPTEKSVKNICVCHNSLVTQPVPYPHIVASDLKTPYDLILCGHIHDEFYYKHNNTEFINSGCITRIKTNEKGICPTFLDITVSDTISINKVKVQDVCKNVAISVGDFREQLANEVLSFDKAVEDAKIDINDIESFINNSKYSDAVKDASLKLVAKHSKTI